MKPGTKVVVVASGFKKPVGATGHVLDYALHGLICFVEWEKDNSVSTIETGALAPWQQLKKAFKYGPKIVKRSR